MKILDVRFIGAFMDPAKCPADHPGIVFTGRSNVGKSTLVNRVVNRAIARTSKTPGRTRQLIYFHVDRARGKPFYLVDLPGYGYAKVAQSVRLSWEKLVSAYLTKRDALRLCVFLVDARHEPMEGDLTLRTFLEHSGLPYVVAATKADKVGNGERQRRLFTLRGGMGAGAQAVTTVSAVTRDGVDDLWRTIRRAAGRPLLASMPGAPETRTDA